MKENIVEEFDDLADLLARKKNNLAMQARLREESKDLDIAIARHPRVAEQVKLSNNTGGATRIDFAEYDFDIKDPIKKIPKKALEIILYGGKESFKVLSKSVFNCKFGFSTSICSGKHKGSRTVGLARNSC